MTSQLALFGTSADPPTVGHRAVLAGLMQLFPRVCTWASDNPFKQHGAPLEVRAALLGAVVDSLSEQAGSERLQLRQDFSSRRAIDSIEAARRCFPEDEPVFVVGTDLVPQIPAGMPLKPGCPAARSPWCSAKAGRCKPKTSSNCKRSAPTWCSCPWKFQQLRAPRCGITPTPNWSPASCSRT